MNSATNPWIVLKFGGSSVCKLQHWQTIAQLIHQYRRAGFKVWVVCSAIRGVTDALEKLCTFPVKQEIFPWIEMVHQRLADEQGLELQACIGAELASLRHFVQQTNATDHRQRTSARTQAQIMAFGESMCTKLGAQWLLQQDLPVMWQDARKLLTCKHSPREPWENHYLAAECDVQADHQLQAQLHQEGAEVVITQGFIASDQQGDTVLLGRGGSDTSAAYFAARLQAKKLEIWTDVPGMFTSDPRCESTATLLHELDYQQAENLARMGAKVLHPKCIAPVRAHGIPMHIRCTESPELSGTVIHA